MMLDENLSILDVSNTSELFGIIVPRGAGSDNEVDGDDKDSSADDLPVADLISPTEKLKHFEQMVYHQFFIEKSYAAVSWSATQPPSLLYSRSLALRSDQGSRSTGQHRTDANESRSRAAALLELQAQADARRLRAADACQADARAEQQQQQ